MILSQRRNSHCFLFISKYGIKVTKGVDFMENRDIHIHFPAGGVGKDGPSAGVTIITVLVSLFSGRCVNPDVAMTGEITLRGLVLPVSNVYEFFVRRLQK